MFLARGYAGASVEDIAAAAGVATRTAFNVFGDKEALFRATIGRSIETAETFADSLDADLAAHGTADRLPQIACEIALTILTGPVVPLRRALAAEADRFPDLIDEYRRRAPDRMLTALASLFERLTTAGHLDAPDPSIAAEHFAFLIMGADLDRGMMHAPAPPRRRIAARATYGAHAFLRAYRTTS